MKRGEFIRHGFFAATALGVGSFDALAKTPVGSVPAILPGGRKRAVPRIDPDRIPQARGVCDFIVRRMDARGRYVPEEVFWFESIGYRSSLAAYLAVAGQLFNEDRYIQASRRMMDTVVEERLGDLWPVGCWAEFPQYLALPVGWRETYLKVPDLRYSALTVAALGICYQACGEKKWIEPARRALAALVVQWNFQREKAGALHLSFEVLALAISAWEKVLPEFAVHKTPILQWVLDTFVETASKDFPFLTMYRTMLVVGETGDKYIDSHLRPGIDALLAEPRWRCREDPRNFFHNQQTAGHVNVRGNGAVAIAMRVLDGAAGEQVYTQTEIYRHVSGWMDGLRRDDGAYYGAREHGEGRRFDLGSPAQYLPLCWMLGGLGGKAVAGPKDGL